MKTTLHKLLNIANIIGFIWLLIRAIFCFVDIPVFFKYGCFYLFLTTWGIEFFVERRWRFTFHREQFFYLLLILFFLWGFLYYPFDGSVYFKDRVELRYPLLAFGIIGFFGLNRYYSKRLVFHVMTLVSTASILFVVANVGILPLILSPDRTELFASFARTHINAHMGFDLYLVMTLIGLWWLNFRNGKVVTWLRVYYAFVALLCLLTLGISDGRAGMGIALIITASILFVEAFKRSRWIAIASVALLFALGGYAISRNGRMTADHLKTENRFGFWRAACDLIAEKPLLGYGMSNAQEEFDKVNMNYLEEYQRLFFAREQPGTKDCHNQFLQTTLEFGVVGLILLLALYLLPCFLVRREWRLLTSLVITACLLQSLFDVFITSPLNLIFCLTILTSLSMKNGSTP